MPSMTTVPVTRELTFQVCGGTRGRLERRSMTAKAVNSPADTLNPATVRTDIQPSVAVPPRVYMRAARVIGLPCSSPTTLRASAWLTSVSAVLTTLRAYGAEAALEAK